MEINFYKKASKYTDLVVLTDKKTKFDFDWLNEKEKKFLKQLQREKKEIITLNQLDRYVYFVLAEVDNDYKTKEKLRKAGYKICNTLNSKKRKTVYFLNEDLEKSLSIAFLEGLMLSNYSFTKYFTKDLDKRKVWLEELKIKDKGLKQRDLDKLKIIVESVFITRDLVNEPFSGLNAVEFADRIKQTGKNAGLTVEVLNKKQIEALKMGGLLTVNRASGTPPTFSVIEWKPENAINKKPYVFVGKGIVFDTGGYNLKPGQYMNDMKADMAGGAAVVGIMNAIAKLQLPVYAIGFVPATDNLIGKSGYVTGDVITMHNGMTVEVLNTDAEGRLILADALSYAQKFNPELVIDMATLTGAAIRAVGEHVTAMFGTAKKKIKKTLINSGKETFERIIEFPLWEEYGDQLKSDIADIKNLGGINAGHITAAKFLEHFTDYPWIHLDIAPSAFLDSKNNYQGKGATGVPVRLILNFIENII